jgi:magnesium transporter
MNGKKATLNKAPGTVVFTGRQKMEQVLITHLQYNEEFWVENDRSTYTFNETFEAAKDKIDWYDVRGLHDTNVIESFGRQFNIHPLALEDIADVHQRPKFDDYPNAIFISLRALHFDAARGKLSYEHLTICSGPGYVISFQEDKTDLFAAVRDRIQTPVSRLRKRKEDYLLYALADTITDHYYSVMEEIQDLIESMEERIINNPSEESKSNIYNLKRELQQARKTLIPLREAIGRFSRCDNPMIDEKTYPFIQDLYDHTIQLNDSLESQRDALHNLQDLYNSEMSFKMNQTMQVLTVISAIFIPLTFLCGVYGMNFINIPELSNPHGYYYLWGLMLMIAGGCLAYFRANRWL